MYVFTHRSTDQESGKSSPDIRKKHPVPNYVREEVRKVYGILEEGMKTLKVGPS